MTKPISPELLAELAKVQRVARALKAIYGSATKCDDRLSTLRGFAVTMDAIADAPDIAP